MNDELTRLRLDYAPPFLAYLANRDEAGLRAAYELGRQALCNAVGLLEVVRVHDEIFLEVMGTAQSIEDAQDLARASSAFLAETLAAFEMTQRGFMDVGGRPEQQADPSETVT